jgi:hypothetical protein
MDERAIDVQVIGPRPGQPLLRHLRLRRDLPLRRDPPTRVSQMCFATEAPVSGRDSPDAGRACDDLVPFIQPPSSFRPNRTRSRSFTTIQQGWCADWRSWSPRSALEAVVERLGLAGRLAALDTCAVSGALKQLGICGVALGLSGLTVGRRIAGAVIAVELGPSNATREALDRHGIACQCFGIMQLHRDFRVLGRAFAVR